MSGRGGKIDFCVQKKNEILQQSLHSEKSFSVLNDSSYISIENKTEIMQNENNFINFNSNMNKDYLFLEADNFMNNLYFHLNKFPKDPFPTNFQLISNYLNLVKLKRDYDNFKNTS